MNGWDALLTWLSLKGTVSWQTMKAACQRLSAAYQVGLDDLPRDHGRRWAEPLIQLGHAEFHQTSTVPPTVVPCLPGIVFCSRGGFGVLYGCWANDRLHAVERAAKLLKSHIPTNGPTCRTLIMHDTDEGAFRRLAEDLKVWFAVDVGEKLITELPTIDVMLRDLRDEQSSADGYWQEVRFRDGLSVWSDSREPLSRPGIYRRLSGSMRRVLVTEDGKILSLPTRDHERAAVWLRAEAKPWHYSKDQQQLLIPSGLPRLPILVCRGLTSVSGRRPEPVRVQNQDWWCYVNVSPSCAEQGARIMQRPMAVSS